MQPIRSLHGAAGTADQVSTTVQAPINHTVAQMAILPNTPHALKGVNIFRSTTEI